MAPDGVREKARAALAGGKYQRVLPQHEAENDPRKPYDWRSRGRGDGRADDSGVAVPLIGAGAFLGTVIFVILLGVVVLLILGWIVREVVERRRRSGGETRPASETGAADAPQVALSFDDASRLAAEGRYAEAVHALLLAAIRHFAERSRTAIQPSRTSRELVRTLPLGPEAREAFGELVRTVELSLFGGAPVGAEDYERNLARFQALTRRAA